jgi:hypothetical protein
MRFFVKVAGEQIEVKTSLAATPDNPPTGADRAALANLS